MNGKSYSAQQLRKSIEEIKHIISTIIERKATEIDLMTHRKFVKAVHRPIRPGKIDYHVHVDYLLPQLRYTS